MTNVDLSSVVIRKQSEGFPEQDWRVMDVLHLDDDWTDRFDAVIDKSMVDTLLCGHVDSVANVLRMFSEAQRVLKPGGAFICWSLHKPHEVVVHAEKLEWGFVSCRVKNPRFDELPAARRSVSHTALVARKRRVPDQPIDKATDLPRLFDPLSPALLRLRERKRGFDDDDDDSGGGGTPLFCDASPVAMSAEDIESREAIQHSLELQEAAQESSVEDLMYSLKRAIVRESIRRKFNDGFGWGVMGIQHWLLGNEGIGDATEGDEDGIAVEQSFEGKEEETWVAEHMSYGDILAAASRGGRFEPRGSDNDDDDVDDIEEEERDYDDGVNGGDVGGGDDEDEHAYEDDEKRVLSEMSQGGYDLDQLDENDYDVISEKSDDVEEQKEGEGSDNGWNSYRSCDPAAHEAILSKEEEFLIDTLRRLTAEEKDRANGE